MEYRLTVTVFSDRQHPPVQFGLTIPFQLAKLLMSTPITNVRLAIAQGGNILDKSKLLEFK